MLLLAACSSASQLAVKTVPTDPPIRPQSRPVLPNPTPIDLQDVEWRVLTPDTLPESGRWSFIGLTPGQYEILSLNEAELRRWIEEAMWLLDYYNGRDVAE